MVNSDMFKYLRTMNLANGNALLSVWITHAFELLENFYTLCLYLFWVHWYNADLTEKKEWYWALLKVTEPASLELKSREWKNMFLVTIQSVQGYVLSLFFNRCSIMCLTVKFNTLSNCFPHLSNNYAVSYMFI
jgi:hypothetical protein